MTRPTRDEKRRAAREEADEADALMARLLRLDEVGLAQIPFDEELASAMRALRAMRHDAARRREIRRLTGALRDADRAPLLEAVRRVEAGRAASLEDEKRWERWRERLLAEGRPGVDALVAAFPHADAARFATLVEEARAAGGAGPAFRQLYRRLRALDD